MNYKIIYDKLITNAKSKNRNKHSGVYFENHHIIPKCIGGNNSEDNLVLLTPKEHYIAHLLLTEIYNNPKLWYVLNCMIPESCYHNNRYIPSSRMISYIRNKYVEKRKGFKHTQYSKDKMSKSRIGIKLTKTTKEKIKITLYGNTRRKGTFQSEFAKSEISSKNRGKKRTLEFCKNLSEKKKGIRFTKEHIDNLTKNSGVSKAVIQYTIEGVLVKEYISIAEAARTIGKSYHLYKCLQDNTNIAYGYMWKYKNLI